MEIIQFSKFAMDLMNTANSSYFENNSVPMEKPNDTTMTDEALLEQYNDEVLVYRLPAIFYTGVMMILGLPGNMVVFYVYFFKWRQSTSRMFILFIAALDMINCATTLPMEIFIMRNSVKLDKPILCKVTRFSTYTMNSASAIILVGIAIDRFIHICRPHSRSFSSKTSMYICIGAIIFAVASTWPSFVLYGTRVFELGKIKCYSCLLENKYDQTPYPMIYLGVIFLITMLLFVVLVVFYTLIGAKIYSHRKSKQRKCTHLKNGNMDDEEPSVEDSGSHYKLAKRPSENIEGVGNKLSDVNEAMVSNDKDPKGSVDANGGMKEVVSSSTDDSKNKPDSEQVKLLSKNNYTDSYNTLADQTTENGSATKENTEHIVSSTPNDNDDELVELPNFKKNKPVRMTSKTSSNSGSRSSQSSNRLTSSVKYLLVRGASSFRRSDRETCTKCVTVRIGRSTLMLFLITLAYILSFVPFYIIVIIRQSDESFVLRLSKSELMAYHLFLRSYLLSSAINPFIYSFCNAQFREYCRDLFLHVILRRPQSRTMSKLQRRF